MGHVQATGKTGLPAAQRTATERVVRAVSLLLSPVTLPPILIAILLLIFRAPLREILIVAGGTGLLLSIIPAAVLALLVRSGHVRSIDVENRRERTVLFGVAVLCGAACLVFVQWQASTAVPILLLAIVLYIVNVGLLFLINLRWKISLHGAAITGFFLFIGFASLADWTTVHRVVPLVELLVATLTLVSLVVWARVRGGNHTITEALAGVLFGFVAPALEIATAARIGLLAGL